MKDPENTYITAEIVEGFDPKWMIFDNSTRTIKFIPQNEPNYGPHEMKFVLTDADG
jgi:hypothetical protein